MPGWALRPLRMLARALAAQGSSRQLAAGFALGMLVGLVPKDNLTAQGLAVVLFASKANLGAGLFSAFVFSWAGLLLDPVAHRLGWTLLTAGPLEPLWTFLYNLPVVPWTAFHHTAVLGNLLLGLALAWPAYRFTRPLWLAYKRRWGRRFRRWRLVQLLLGAELGSRFR